MSKEQRGSFRHPGDTVPSDLTGERTFLIRFKSGKTVTVRAQSGEQARLKAYKQMGGKFGQAQANSATAATTSLPD